MNLNMFIYFFILSFVSLWIIIERESIKRNALVLPTLLLVLFATIRSVNVGTDTPVYVNNFISSSPENYIFNPDLDYGYQFFEYFLLHITNDYWFLFAVTSFVIVTLSLYTIKKYSINYLISVWVYLTFGFYTFFFNTLRQGLAISICFFSLSFLFERKYFNYFIFVLFASLFHVSALIMLIFLFTPILERFKVGVNLCILLIISFIFTFFYLDIIFERNQRYLGYSEISDEKGGYYYFAFNVIMAFFLYLSLIDKNLDYKHKLMLKLYLYGVVLVLPVLFLNTDPSGPQRLLFYFNPVLIFLIPLFFKFYNNIIYYLLFIIFSFTLFFVSIMKFGGIYPYEINPNFILF